MSIGLVAKTTTTMEYITRLVRLLPPEIDERH